MSAPAQGRSRIGILLSLTIAAAICMALPGAASGAIGDITGMSCISKTGTNGCSPLPAPNMLNFSAGVELAPDGTDLYVGSSHGIAHFRRAADGTLTYASCIDTTSGAVDGCPETSAPSDGGGSLNANGIHLSIAPDGKFLYAVGQVAALVWFSRDTNTGELEWGGCKDAHVDAATNNRCGTGTTFGSGNFPAGSMAFPQGIEVMPDGGSLYIADQQEGLIQAQINTTTGVPTPQDCFNTAGSGATGCIAVSAGFPMAGIGLAVADNNRDIYLSSVSPGGVTHFQRSLGAYTTAISCITTSPSATCLTGAASPAFLNPGDIAAAGNHVFTQGGNYGVPDGTIAKFSRAANGALTFMNCATTVVASGPCAVLPAGTLTGNNGRLPVSPDGSSIYSPQLGANVGLTRLTGDLAFGSCIGISPPTCSAPPLPAAFVVGGGGTAISPDGKQLYQGATDQINTFQLSASANSPVPTPPATPAAPKAAKPRIRSLRKMRKGRHRGKYRVKITVARAGAIATRFEGRLKRRAKIRSLSRLAKRSARHSGTYTIYVKPSKAAAKRRLKVKLVVTFSPPGYVAAKATKSIRLR